MNIAKLTEYSKRKELSGKAKKEIVELIERDLPIDVKETEELIALIGKFHSDISYAFFSVGYVGLTDELKTCACKGLKMMPPDKSARVFSGIVGLFHAKIFDNGYEILRDYILVNGGGKIKKPVLTGFESACCYESSDKLFVKMNWDKKPLNTYRNFLGQLLQFTHKKAIKEQVAKWFKENNYDMIQSEVDAMQDTIDKTATDNTSASSFIENEERNKENVSKATITSKLDIFDLLIEVQDRIKIIRNEDEKLKSEYAILASDMRGLRNRNADMVKQLAQSNEQIVIQREKIVDLETEISKLTSEILRLHKENRDLADQREKLQAKLNNVESAFGQAGQTELDALKEKIGTRLQTDYQKYSEIRELVPDIDYYEILLTMLDGIFRVLKKNGINL